MSKEDYEILTERSPCLIAVFNRDARCRYVNTALQHALGIAPADLVGKTAAEIWAGGDEASRFEAAVREVLGTGRKKTIALAGPERQGARSYRAGIFPLRSEDHAVISAAAHIQDITDLKTAEISAEKDRERLANIVETVPDGIAILDRNGRITFANKAAERLLGLSRDSITRRLYNDPEWKITTVNGHPFPGRELPFARVMRTGKPVQGVEHAIERPDGTRTILSVNAAPLTSRNGTMDEVIAAMKDITQKHATENELHASEQRFKEVINSAPFGAHFYELKEDGRLIFTGANIACGRILKVDCSRFIGKTIEEAFPALTATEIPAVYRRTALTGEPYERIQIEYNEQGISGAYEIHAFQTGIRRMAVLFQDITERKRAENMMRASEERFRSLTETTSDWIWETDRKGTYTYSNPKVRDITGFEPKEVVGKTLFDFMPPDEREHLAPIFQKALSSPQPFYGVENISLHKNGRLVVLETSAVPVFDKDGNLAGYRGIDRDITERKRSEEALQRSEQRYRSMVEVISDWIWEIDANGRYTYASPKSLDMLGYAPSEIVGKTPFDLMPPEVAARVGEKFGRVAREHKAFFGIENENIRKDGRRVILETSGIPVFDQDGHFTGYRGIDRDITERKKAEREITAGYERMERLTNGIIGSISKIVETRDPYTAGHQRRVGQLAAAIAGELGFSARQRNDVRIAGLLHDVGKIYVPAEILSKPGKLSAVETGVVRTHPLSGYEILKNIAFSSPVAEIAYQHQERLNGYGYPRGLKADQILFETKIISVADTVEAMSFFRPYRAVIGVDKALEEIEKGKDILYDARVVDACVALFKVKGFRFEE